MFAGGWNFDAAESVAADGDEIDGWEVMELLSALVDKSLVQAEPRADWTRYRILETIRQYAADVLLHRGEPERLATAFRHRDHYLALVEDLEQRVEGKDTERFERVGLEHDNLRAAMTTTQLDPHGAQKGLRLVAALARFWRFQGHATEGIERATAALARVEALAPTRERTLALVAVADLMFDVGEYSAAGSLAEEALTIAGGLGDTVLAIDARCSVASTQYRLREFGVARATAEQALEQARQLGDPGRTGRCLNMVAAIAFESGDPVTARPLYEEALALRRQEGNRGAAADVMNNLALMEIDAGNLDTAVALLREVTEVQRELRDEAALARVLGNLGVVAIHRGDARTARADFGEALTLADRYGLPLEVAESVLGFALIATLGGELVRASTLHGAADRLFADLGTGLGTVDAERRTADLEHLKKELGSEAFDAAYRDGAELSRRDAVAYALGG